MIRVFAKTFGAGLARSRALLALAVAGVALGVACVVAIQVLNRSAVGAFSATVDAISGRADLTVLGRGPTFDETLYPRVLEDPAVARAAPSLEIPVRIEGRESLRVDLFGVDFLGAGNALFDAAELDGPRPELGAPLVTPGYVVLTRAVADRLGVHAGDAVRVAGGTRRGTLRLGRILDFSRRSPLFPARAAFMDVARAQALFGLRGRLCRVDLVLRPGADLEAARARIASALGPGTIVVTPAEQESRAAGLLRAFRVNLTALSLVSVLVGAFLVTSATKAALTRRRREFGVLRALGATRLQVAALMFAQTALLGAAGVVVGWPLGLLGARAGLDSVSATMTNLYLLEEIAALDVPAYLLPLAVVLGVGAALLGALAPVIDVARGEPRDLLAAWQVHDETHTRPGRLASAGAVVFILCGAWYAALGAGTKAGGFVLGVAVLVVLSLACPWIAARCCAPGPLRSFGFSYARKSLAARLSTASFAMAALAVAVSMTVGITVMVASFRDTVSDWVDRSIRADVYVSTRARGRAGNGVGIDAATCARLAGLPGVRAADRLRETLLWKGDERLRVRGVDVGFEGGRDRFPLQAGEPAAAYAQFESGGAVLLGEPLARRLALGPGAAIELPLAAGARAFPIAGVFYDYSSEFGSVVMSMDAYAKAFGPGAADDVALYLDRNAGGAGDVDSTWLVERLAEEFSGGELTFRSNDDIRAAVFRIFDQTFLVTRLLQVMSLLIAAVGVTLALLVLGRERAAEIALCRSLGALRGQIARMYVGKGLALGLLGLLPGLAGGLALAWVLVFAINRAWFGWTIRLGFPAGAVLFQSGTILLAAALAAIYPAVRASRVPASELSREDL